MNIICDSANPSKVRIWTDSGIDITEDLKPLLIELIVTPDEETTVVITCPLKGFIMNGGYGEHSIVEAPEENHEE